MKAKLENDGTVTVFINEIQLNEAARILHGNYREDELKDYGDSTWAKGTLRAALRELGIRTDLGLCGGCRGLGPHRNVPGCDFYVPGLTTLG